MERYRLLAWLFELIRRTPEPALTDVAERLEAIEIRFAGKRFLIRVDVVAA